MGVRTKINDSTVGPGPASCDVSGLSIKGRCAPREMTLGIKPEPLKKFRTPGPGEYDVVNAGKSVLMSSGVVRGFTFGHPALNFKSGTTPGIFRLLGGLWAVPIGNMCGGWVF